MGLHRPLVAESKAVYSQWDELDLELMKSVGREETIRPQKSSPNFVEASYLLQITVEAKGWIEDVWGNRYYGGGNYSF